MRPLLLALAILAAAPLVAQDDEQPFFSVSSSRTWTSKDKPSVQISSWNVDTLEFRLYRIQDPVQFFSQLKDLHQFGGREGKPHKQTLLERFHDWKDEGRFAYRSLIRDQFDEQAHARVSKLLDRRRAAQANRRITHFTPLPLLNPQRVVSVWKEYMPKRGGWSYEPVHFDNPGKGIFLLEAADRDLRAYTIVVVSDIAMITKVAPGRLVTYVADRQTGAPVAETSVTALNRQQTVAQLTGNADGIASAPLVLKDAENIVVLARRDSDWAVESPFGFNFREEVAASWTGLIYTDRPVYRPGHPVNFKAVLRTLKGLSYLVPSGAIDLRVQDPDGNDVFRKKAVPLSQFGTAWSNFTLRPDAALGYYSVIAEAPNMRAVSGGFQVEEYKKPEYEVRVAIKTPRVLEGDPIRASIDARYYFGEPVANAKVTWVAHRAPYYSPVFWRDDDEEGEPVQDDQTGGGDEMKEQTAKLDSNGHLDITVPTALGRDDFSYRIEARVTDEGSREIAGSAAAIATRGSFVLNIEPDRYGYAPGQQARFHIQARDYEGNPVATRATVDLLQWNWRDTAKPARVATIDGTTDSTGDGTVSLTIPRNYPSLSARVTATTPEGRTVTANVYLWVSAGNSEDLLNGQDIQILPDQKTYKPGDIARIMIVSQTRLNHVLVSVEGRNIDVPQILHPGAKSFAVDIPVKAEYAPNFFVSACSLLNGEMHQGVKRISVPATDRKLEIEVQPSKDQYKPGETARYNVSAKDSAGRPAAAEVSLGVVDEAIYSIQPDRTLDMTRVFYGDVNNDVNTDSSLTYFFSGAAGLRRMQLASLRPPTALAALKPERLVQPKIRKAFPDTAFWLANLTTDAAGHGVAQFDFPDSLTTWRATARAITEDTKVGSAVQKTIVRKNLMVRLVAPRFLTQGDEVVISAIVHNYLKTAKTARVSLDLQGLDVIEGSQQDVSIPSSGDAKVDWRVHPRAVEAVTITAKALTDEESDGIQITLPVNPRGVKNGVSRTGVLTEDSTTFDLPWPAQSAPLGRTLTIDATPSLAGSLFGALDYLTEFPWGCTEQTMSSILPNLIVADAEQKLGIKPRLDPADLNVKVRAGLDRLYNFQHPDGGWGWWPTDDSSVFMTAYVVAGLNQAQDLGQKIKTQSLQRGVKWLRAAVAKERDLDPDLRAYAAYAVREDIEPAWDARARLSPYGLALFGLALDSKHDNRATQIAAELESKVQQDADGAHWQMDRDPLMDFSVDASPEATATALKLLTRVHPNSPLLLKAARWLVAHRNQGFWWSSTKQTAMVVYGLTDYLKQTRELSADLVAAVRVNGGNVLSKHLTAEESARVVVPGDGSNERVNITRTGPGRLYWSTRGDYYSTDRKLVDTGTVKLNVIREYFRLIEGRDRERIVYDLRPLDGPLKVGDLLGVRLTVSGTAWQYTIAEDPIPAGSEFVSRDDLYELRDPTRWWQNAYSRREFHDDRAAFFNRYFNNGQTQYFYLLRMTNAGKFNVNPARVWPMYQADKLATTGSALVTVQ